MQVNVPEDLAEVMQVDRYRLRRQWQRLQRRGATGQADEQWRAAVEQSRKRARRRQAIIPAVKYDPDLPITSHRKEILAALEQRGAIVVCGETGSGKSTQLPKFCLEAGYAVHGMIGHTQPRRLAARAVADRLAAELGTRIGDKVGYKIRFSDATGPDTLIKVMTDGILLAETQSDRFLDQYTCLIIDEAHERSLNIDFILGYLKRIRQQRPDLKIIITSATIDPERFANHLADEQGPAPIIEVSGRSYPVEIRYRPPNLEADEETGTIEQAVIDALVELEAEGRGDTLVFLPTERDIRNVAKHVRGWLVRSNRTDRYELLPLYARLSEPEQNRIFNPGAKPRIILATNVAESTITVPRVRYVIDSGLVRISRYAPRSMVRRLPIEAISQASADQRAGRCGRLEPGICIRLYSEEDFEQRPKFTTPEIRRSDLASVLLQSMVLQLGPLEEFPLMDPPGSQAIRDAQRTLSELGAIDRRGKLTALGKRLGNLPCDPRIGRILLAAADAGCLPDMLVIAAALECPDIRRRPETEQAAADHAHARFADPHSDFLGYLRLWRFCENLRERLSRSQFRRAMAENYLSVQGYWQWRETVRQLRELMKQAGYRCQGPTIQLDEFHNASLETSDGQQQSSDNRRDKRKKRGKKRVTGGWQWPEGYERLHQALLTGLLRGIAMRVEGGHEYRGARGTSAVIWPGSGLFKEPPKWLVAAETVETSQRYLRTVGAIDPAWLEVTGKEFLKHSYADPHWSKKAGRAMVYRSSTLFGLSVVSRRREPLAPIDPATARELLIEHGLVAGECRCQEDFYQHNVELLADLNELMHRSRNAHVGVDRYDLIEFYRRRLPESVVDLPSLQHWWRREASPDQRRQLYLQPGDLLQIDESLDSVDELFPNTITINGVELPLRYHFEPGHERDGVILRVPATALRQLDEQLLEWLVPGHLAEKILHLIRSLPKSKRMALMPANQTALEVARELRPDAYKRPFWRALTEALSRRAGETIRPSDFDLSRVPPHARFMMEVIDNDGDVIGYGRELKQLVAQFAPAETVIESGVREASQSSTSTVRITLQDFVGLPNPRPVDHPTAGRSLAFPGLVDAGEHVELRWFDNSDDARQANRQGLTRLFAQYYRRQLRQHVQHLPGSTEAQMKLAHLLPKREPMDELAMLIVRIALVDGRPIPTSREEVEALKRDALREISIAVQEVAGWLPKLAENCHQVRKRLESVPRSWSQVGEDIRGQLAELFTDDWMRNVEWQWLREYPRYLEGIIVRLERLPSAGLARDQRAADTVRQLWNLYQERLSDCCADEERRRIEQARWMIEEFRVAQFAQKLGTRVRVSEKRIREMLE